MSSRDDSDKFQRGLLGSPHCKGCNLDCEIVYDRHHDEYFSLACGTVVMSMGEFCVPYYDDLDLIFQRYDERFVAYREKMDKKRERDRRRRGE